jgi:hypothetical protein
MVLIVADDVQHSSTATPQAACRRRQAATEQVTCPNGA